MITIYHNTRCSKSREALCLLEKSIKKLQVIEYITTPPTKEELIELIKKLRIKPIELVRKNESVYLEKYKGKKLNSSQWISAMIKHPILIERPIIINGNDAIIGRPPEKVVEFLKQYPPYKH